MRKKITIFALVVSLLLAVVGSGVVQAGGELRILDTSTEVEFPTKLQFALSAESAVDITDIRLYYNVDRESYAEVINEVYIKFVPDKVVDVQWLWDMRKGGGLPAGSSITYWWTVKDVAGDKIETAPLQLLFDDNRYSWHSLTEGEVTLYWYEGGQSFAEELMLTIQQALTRLADDTGAYLKKPVKMYIYANSQDLQNAMIFPKEWTGGVAFTEFGIIAIGIAPGSLVWGRTAIAHELTHLVIHKMTYNPYIRLPVWLDEGLAMYSEGLLDPGYTATLKRAIAGNTLISVRSLASPFSTHAEESYLSYAQSYSLVQFLITTYGRDKMLDLLNTFRDGSDYDAALEQVYGFDMDGLNVLWQEYVGRQYQEAEVTVTEEKEMPTAIVATLAALATAVLLVLSLVAESWAWRRGW